MGKSGCAVFGCVPSKVDSRHTFPDPEKYADLFRKWMIAIGNKTLINLDNKYVYKHYVVCRKHFEICDMGPNNRVKRGSVPKLYLPSEVMQTDRCMPTSATSSSEIPETSNRTILTTPESLKGGVETIGAHDIIFDQQYPTTSSSTIHFTDETVLKTPPSQKGNLSLLKRLNVRKSADLTPKARYLYREATFLKRRERRQRRKRIDLRKRLVKARKYSNTTAFQKATLNLSDTVINFFKSQIACSKKTPHGRRFTLGDKITALALYKQTGSGYRFLSNIFALPSRITLMKLLNNIPIEAGLNTCVFDGLKTIAKKLKPLDKYCILLFDEMSIAPNMYYNKANDVVEGFENFGDFSTSNIADHVQVFMLRGIHRKWKQPILYQYVHGAVKGTQIVKTLKQVVMKAFECGFHIVGTVCDQGSNNVSAINYLINDTQQHYQRSNEKYYTNTFEIGGNTIIPIYDPPHLMKGVRNNLLAKDIFFRLGDRENLAKWEDIYTAWQLDNFSGNLRIMPKLTEQHVNKLHIRKMKVSVCTQVFSHTVSSAINLMAISEHNKGDIKMRKRAVETAEFLKFFDTVFDSVNGFGMYCPSGKNLHKHVSTTDEHNDHIKFWTEAIKTIDTMKTIDSSGSKRVPPSFKNWVFSLKNFILLRDVLKEAGFRTFNPRYINQDPLENFFGQIRQRGVRFTNPTCSAFGPYYKSLLVNNLTSKHSVGGNCEYDKCDILITLKQFIQTNTEHHANVSQEDDGIPVFPIPGHFDMLKPLEESALTYVAGFIVHTLKVGDCIACKYNILRRDNEDLRSFNFIKLKDYNGALSCRLQYVNKEFLTTCTKIYNIVRFILRTNPTEKKILFKIVNTLKASINFNFIECEHSKEFIDRILTKMSILLIHNYFKGVNNLINGKDRRQLPENCSVLYKNASLLHKFKK